ncbi:3-deoxy-manno-octulosonate cytidylyltransferase [Mesobacillus thioparans]|uniref:3-deoxy-manno-octulosonate cytidylyltransferase n=1 Tax=Mesobacillus thioparans TaxID=370439 RepID=UPI0039EEBF09
MRALGIIPARYGSTRFPGKPLALINHVPMIVRVYKQVKRSTLLDEVIVATDHIEIKRVVEEAGGKAFLTQKDHETGSDRIAEVAEAFDCDFVVNIQGDEPLIDATLIDDIINKAQAHPQSVISAMTKIEDRASIDDPNNVKVVSNEEGKALYFSRSPIPYNRQGSKVNYYKHIGIYGYPKSILLQFIKWKPSTLETIEVLEQLRLMENNIPIHLVETNQQLIGVDNPDDIQKVEKLLEAQNNE